MKSTLATLLLFLAFPGMTPAAIKGVQDMREEAKTWLAKQVQRTFPDAEPQVEIGLVDSRLRLGACEDFRFQLASGARLWSGGSLGVQCVAPTQWTLYLTYQVQLSGPALSAAHPLPARHLLGPNDVVPAWVRYASDPGVYVREIPAGAVTQRPMSTNQPILIHDLILPDVVQAGAKVRVKVQGAGFSVAQEGKALNAAKAGGAVQVKMPTGRIVRGTANHAGEVEIRP